MHYAKTYRTWSPTPITLGVSLRCLTIDIRSWSLVTGKGGGGLHKGRGGGACEVLPLWKEAGAEQVLAMLKAGHTKFWGSFYAVA